MAEVFVFSQQRVRFQDVDHAGIVFFAKIYEYCHVALEEFLEQEIGYPPQVFFSMDNDTLGAPLVATNSTHHHPLFHGDQVAVSIQMEHLGRTSMKVAYKIHNGEGVLCACAWTTHVFVDRTMTKHPIPDEMRTKLTRFLKTDTTCPTPTLER